MQPRKVLVVAILGFRNHTRFNRLIKAATTNGKRSDVQVADRLTYFRDMNLLLSVALVAFGGSMFILCIDGYTADKIINSNKFAADLLICNTNISSIFLWLIIVSTAIVIRPLLIDPPLILDWHFPSRSGFDRGQKETGQREDRAIYSHTR
jgi:hypothetical protein